MKYKATDPDANRYKVLLNRKIILYAIEANEEEGWVEVIDTKKLAASAPIFEDTNQKPVIQGDSDNPIVVSDLPEEELELPTKKLFGSVKILQFVK